MGRRKWKEKVLAQKLPAKKAKLKILKTSESAVIKRSLRKSVKEPVEKDENKKEKMGPLRSEIERIVIEMTKVLKFGCTNLHVCLCHLFDTGTRYEIEKEFRKHIDSHHCFFSDYSRGMSMIDDSHTGYILNPTVKRLCLEYAIDLPDIVGIGNMFKFSIKKYCVNFMNNICTHAYNRIRKFFYTRTRNKRRIYDTLHCLFQHDSEKAPDPDLIESIENELQPIGFGNGLAYFCDMQKKWYRYVPMFMALQEYIRDHMAKRQKDLDERGATSLRKCTNFTVITITTFKRHHIGIDDDGLYDLLKKIGSKHEAIRRKNRKSKRTKLTTFSPVTAIKPSALEI